jgi:hypothetical protein
MDSKQKLVATSLDTEFKKWVTTVWRPDDGAELLNREWPKFAFAAFEAGFKLAPQSALASLQPAQEPVAWMRNGTEPGHNVLHNFTMNKPPVHGWTPLYAPLPQSASQPREQIRNDALQEVAASFERFFSRKDELDVGYVIDAIRALQSKDGKDGAGDAEDARRLDWLQQHTNCEVGCDWEEDSPWVVHRITGSRNDREWKEIGRGETVRAAIDAAIAAIAQKENGNA